MTLFMDCRAGDASPFVAGLRLSLDTALSGKAELYSFDFYADHALRCADPQSRYQWADESLWEGRASDVSQSTADSGGLWRESVGRSTLHTCEDEIDDDCQEGEPLALPTFAGRTNTQGY